MGRDLLNLSTGYQVPVEDFETALAELWALALRLDRVGRNDDFFDLGGDSFAAAVIATQIEERFEIEFPPANIIGHSTVALQARLVKGIQKRQRPGMRESSCLTGCHVSGRLPPLFLVHGRNGTTFLNKKFFERLGVDQPAYLFQAPGIGGVDKPMDQVEKIAKRYISEIQAIQPQGPYNIGAFCAGGFIALEMCLQLRKQGQSVGNLLLLDPGIVPGRLAHRYPPVFRKDHGWGYRWRVYLKRLLARTRNFLGGRGFVLDEAMWSWKENSYKLKRRRQKLLTRIRDRRSIGDFSNDESQYDLDRMIGASLELYAALENYAPATRYDGHAHLLVNGRLGEWAIRPDFFWSDYLGSFDHETMPGDHGDFFDKNMLLVADFVKGKMGGSSRPERTPDNLQV